MLKEIASKLEELKTTDSTFAIFGSNEHRYELGTALSIDEVKHIEKFNGLALPVDYIEFITTIGNGGAGKDYGFHSLEKAIEYGKIDGSFMGVEELMKDAGEIEWEKNRTKLLNNHGDSLSQALSTQDFSKVETIELFKAAEQNKLITKSEEQYWIYYQIKSLDEYPFNFSDLYVMVERTRINGYIELFQQGCGHVAALVIKGKSLGKIIEINNDGVLRKTDLTFQEYYLDWLNESIKKMSNEVDE